jgi:hypothetical protein
MEPFKPDAREQKLIDEALAAHHRAQATGRTALDRLVRSEAARLVLMDPRTCVHHGATACSAP